MLRFHKNQPNKADIDSSISSKAFDLTKLNPGEENGGRGGSDPKPSSQHHQTRLLTIPSEPYQEPFFLNIFPADVDLFPQFRKYFQYAGAKRVFSFITPDGRAHVPGPNVYKLNQLLAQTDYCLEITNGQRFYQPPPSHTDYQPDGPPAHSEIFVGSLPKDVFEDSLIPLFESVGKIYHLRLMMDTETGQSRGFAFITYFNEDTAEKAVEMLNHHEISPSHYIKVKRSNPNLRLFLRGIPKTVDRERIKEALKKIAGGLNEIIITPNQTATLHFGTHSEASNAKKLLADVQLWGHPITVEWAAPLPAEDEPNEADTAALSKVRTLHVANLTPADSEASIMAVFKPYGAIERFNKRRMTAFITFTRREDALTAMEALNGTALPIDGQWRSLEITLARPAGEKKRQEDFGRCRRRRLMSEMEARFMNTCTPMPPMPSPCTLQNPSAAAVAAQAELFHYPKTPVPLPVDQSASTSPTGRLYPPPLVRGATR